MTQTMRAIEITKPGGPDVLQPTERPMPQAGHGQVVIKVAFAGVNRPDALQRAGMYAPPKTASDLPGLEASGVIAEVGAGVTDWAVGDKVCALLPGGGYAEYVATPAAHCLPVPEGMDMKQAACLPETFFTVWSNVFTRGGLKGGERFLIHGGSSGIGTTAIQLAQHFGARVFVTAGSAEKCAACVELGAERAINYKDEDFVEVMKEAGGADLILDMVGGDYIPRNLSALTMTGSTLRPQSDLAKARIAQDLREAVWPLLAAGKIAPVMDSTFAFERACDAHARMETSTHIGKIVLEIGGA